MLRWLKNYMPRGLYGRAALILILPVVTLQLVVSVSFIQRHYAGVTDQMTRSIALELGYLLDTIAAAPDLTGALTEGGAVAEALGMQIVLPDADADQSDTVAFYDLSGRVVADSLRARVDGISAVRLVGIRQVILWTETTYGPMRVQFSRIRITATNPHQLVVLMVVLGALMTLIAFVYLRNQLRPVKQLANAASDYGKGRIVNYSPRGATEVRAAGAAFLDMRNRIERQVAQRRLMLSGISHDLRTPLTRLRLGLSLLPEEEAAPLRSDVDEMQHLLDAFLDYARGTAEDEGQPTDILALVSEVVESARRAGGIVDLKAPTVSIPDLDLRPLAIRRALDNLIGNALRYGARAEVVVMVTDRTVQIVVEDDGPGIPEDKRDEATRPFTRLDPARNQDKGSGVGLGLAIVSDIARTHGGMLRLGQSASLGGLRAELVLAR